MFASESCELLQVDTAHVHGGLQLAAPQQLLVPLDALVATTSELDAVHLEFRPPLTAVAASSEELAEVNSELFGDGMCAGVSLQRSDDYTPPRSSAASSARGGEHTGTRRNSAEGKTSAPQQINVVPASSNGGSSSSVDDVPEPGDRTWHFAPASTPSSPSAEPPRARSDTSSTGDAPSPADSAGADRPAGSNQSSGSAPQSAPPDRAQSARPAAPITQQPDAGSADVAPAPAASDSHTEADAAERTLDSALLVLPGALCAAAFQHAGGDACLKLHCVLSHVQTD